LESTQWVISAVHEKPVTLVLLQGLQNYDYKGQVAVAARKISDVKRLTQAGADQVLIPYEDGAAQAIDHLFGGKIEHKAS